MGRRCEIRRQNERIANAARLHHFDDLSPVPFLCECDDPSCREFLTLLLPMFESLRDENLYLIAPGHRLAAGRRVVDADGYEGHLADLAPGSA